MYFKFQVLTVNTALKCLWGNGIEPHKVYSFRIWYFNCSVETIFSQLLWDTNIIDEGLLQMKKFGPKHPWGLGTFNIVSQPWWCMKKINSQDWIRLYSIILSQKLTKQNQTNLLGMGVYCVAQ